MNKTGNLLLLLALALVLAACASTPEPPPPQTGVHLQARFETPELVEGQAPSHSGMDYLIYFPEGYGQDADKEWPLILFDL